MITQATSSTPTTYHKNNDRIRNHISSTIPYICSVLIREGRQNSEIDSIALDDVANIHATRLLRPCLTCSRFGFLQRDIRGIKCVYGIQNKVTVKVQKYTHNTRQYINCYHYEHTNWMVITRNFFSEIYFMTSYAQQIGKSPQSLQTFISSSGCACDSKVSGYKTVVLKRHCQ